MKPKTGLVQTSAKLAEEVDKLCFQAPVAFTYNPLRYAFTSHKQYLEKYGKGDKEVLLVGMNPGPFGMAQTGVPFGEISFVRDWMGIHEEVQSPARVHPKRPIEGFACTRSEVSGARLWGFAKARFGSAEAFFSRFFVTNYCPLAFLEESGRNRTPDKLPSKERESLFAHCDQALLQTAALLKPTYILGIGAFATKRIEATFAKKEYKYRFGTILHPSPASPRANRGWAKEAEAQLRALGIILPDTED